MSHTPGPWTSQGVVVMSLQKDRIIGRADWGGSTSPEFDEAMRNARLIAAAPELLAALIAVVDNIELLDNPSDQGISSHSDTVENCRVAIAKAEGHS